jgi:hypothetical protein
MSQEEKKKEFNLLSFKRVSSNLSAWQKNLFIDKIIPSKRYKYIECIYHNFGTQRGTLLATLGDSVSYSKKVSNYYSYSGFLYNSLEMGDNYYFIAVNEKDSIEIIDNQSKVLTFLGKIDNIEEAVLVVMIKGFYFDKINKKLCAFKEINDSYYFYTAEEKNCIIYSIRAVLKKTGEFNIVDKTLYKKESPCINF